MADKSNSDDSGKNKDIVSGPAASQITGKIQGSYYDATRRENSFPGMIKNRENKKNEKPDN